MIERVHRGSRRPNENNDRPNNNDDRPPVIHARFFNWNHVENLKNFMWKHGKDSGIYVDQRFGPNTTYRRNKALAARCQLLTNVTVAGERDIFDFTPVVVTAVKIEGHCVV